MTYKEIENIELPTNKKYFTANVELNGGKWIDGLRFVLTTNGAFADFDGVGKWEKVEKSQLDVIENAANRCIETA